MARLQKEGSTSALLFLPALLPSVFATTMQCQNAVNGNSTVTLTAEQASQHQSATVACHGNIASFDHSGASSSHATPPAYVPDNSTHAHTQPAYILPNGPLQNLSDIEERNRQRERNSQTTHASSPMRINLAGIVHPPNPLNPPNPPDPPNPTSTNSNSPHQPNPTHSQTRTPVNSNPFQGVYRNPNTAHRARARDRRRDEGTGGRDEDGRETSEEMQTGRRMENSMILGQGNQ